MLSIIKGNDYVYIGRLFCWSFGLMLSTGKEVVNIHAPSAKSVKKFSPIGRTTLLNSHTPTTSVTPALTFCFVALVLPKNSRSS